jgi:hypothetical protein
MSEFFFRPKWRFLKSTHGLGDQGDVRPVVLAGVAPPVQMGRLVQRGKQRRHGGLALVLGPGLPDGIFSNQISKFW